MSRRCLLNKLWRIYKYLVVRDAIAARVIFTRFADFV
jgi:hypothetical protein